MARKPKTAAEERLIRAAIRERELMQMDAGYSRSDWDKAWNNYAKAVRAVLKERGGK